MIRLGRLKISVLTIVVSVVLMLVVSAGVAGAISYYTVHTTTASLTVDEAFTVDQWDGDSWEACSPTFTWTASVHPGETITQLLRVNNLGTAPLTAHVTEGSGNISGAGNYTVPANGFKDITFTLVVNSSAIPKTYVSYITISMQN